MVVTNHIVFDQILFIANTLVALQSTKIGIKLEMKRMAADIPLNLWWNLILPKWKRNWNITKCTMYDAMISIIIIFSGQWEKGMCVCVHMCLQWIENQIKIDFDTKMMGIKENDGRKMEKTRSANAYNHNNEETIATSTIYYHTLFVQHKWNYRWVFIYPYWIKCTEKSHTRERKKCIESEYKSNNNNNNQ